MKELLNKKRLLLSLKVFAPYVIASFLTSGYWNSSAC